MATAASSTSAVRPSVVITEGFVAGLIGAAVVMVVYFIFDYRTGQPFRTPAVMQALLFEGPQAVRGAELGAAGTLQFTLIHFAAWIVAGFFAALVASVTEAFPRLWYVVMAGVAIVFCAFVWGTGVWRIEDFNSNHIWLGALVGSFAMGAYLAWRHPRILSHLED